MSNKPSKIKIQDDSRMDKKSSDAKKSSKIHYFKAKNKVYVKVIKCLYIDLKRLHTKTLNKLKTI